VITWRIVCCVRLDRNHLAAFAFLTATGEPWRSLDAELVRDGGWLARNGRLWNAAFARVSVFWIREGCEVRRNGSSLVVPCMKGALDAMARKRSPRECNRRYPGGKEVSRLQPVRTGRRSETRALHIRSKEYLSYRSRTETSIRGVEECCQPDQQQDPDSRLQDVDCAHLQACWQIYVPHIRVGT
jgi:hypothetical protein